MAPLVDNHMEIKDLKDSRDKAAMRRAQHGSLRQNFRIMRRRAVDCSKLSTPEGKLKIIRSGRTFIEDSPEYA
jgi:hypothetical protein